MLDQVQNVALHVEIQPNTGLVAVHEVLDPLVFFVQAKVNIVVAIVALGDPPNDLTFLAARDAQRIQNVIQEQIPLAAQFIVGRTADGTSGTSCRNRGCAPSWGCIHQTVLHTGCPGDLPP